MKLGVLEECRMVLDLWSSLGSLSGQVSLLNQSLFRRFFLCIYKNFCSIYFCHFDVYFLEHHCNCHCHHHCKIDNFFRYRIMARKMIGAKKNCDTLKGMLHLIFMDLAIVATLIVSERVSKLGYMHIL